MQHLQQSLVTPNKISQSYVLHAPLCDYVIANEDAQVSSIKDSMKLCRSKHLKVSQMCILGGKIVNNENKSLQD